MLVSIVMFSCEGILIPLAEKILTMRGALNHISALDYPKSRVEVILCNLTLSKTVHATKKTDGPPLVRIMWLPLGIGDAMNHILKIAHGDAVFVIEPGLLPVDMIQQVEKQSGKRVFFGKNYYTVPKHFQYPEDTICPRSATYVQAVFRDYEIIGDSGRLSKKEILRYVYRFGELSTRKKINLTWRYCNGKK